jgi:uncharacterized membrane protein YjjP (DUF1212 family)
VYAHQFVLEIGRAMNALGSASYRTEDTMDACCRALGLEGSFFSTPTAIMAAIGEPGAERKTTLLRVQPGADNLGRLAELYVIRDDVMRGELTPAEGLAVVRMVLEPARDTPLRDVLAHGLAGAGAGVLFGLNATGAAFAGGAGLLVGLLALAAPLRPGLADLQAPLACALVAFLVNIAAAQGLRLEPMTTTIAATVVLLPGLSFTTALAELSMRHLASGSARLMGALAVLLTMAVGVGIGQHCAHALVRAPEAIDLAPLAFAWHLVALAVIGVAYMIRLRAVRGQFTWILFAVGLGFGGARLGGLALGTEVGAFLGALAVAVAGNLYARWRRQPAAVVSTPGLLLLVPGSLGFRSLTVAEHDASQGIHFLFQMLLVGGSIVAGLLMAGVLQPPPLDIEPDSSRRAARP